MSYIIPEYKENLNDTKNLQNLSEDARVSILVENNQRLVLHIVKKFGEDEDLFQEGNIGLIKAAHSFDLNRNINFATYASRCIENEILMYLRFQKRQKDIMYFGDIISVDFDGNNLCLEDTLRSQDDMAFRLEEKEKISTLFNEIQQLKPMEKYIVTHMYGIFGTEKYTQNDIAKNLGLSQPHISRLKKEAIKKLHKRLKNII